MNSERTRVYFLYQKSVLIYIGYSYCLERRLKQHKNKEFDYHYSIPGGPELERFLIEKLKPRLNIAFTDAPKENHPQTLKLTITLEQYRAIEVMADRQEWSKAKAARKIFEMGLEYLDKKR